MKTKFKKLILLCLIGALIGCGGRNANPVPAYHVGDASLLCSEIEAEMAHVSTQVTKLVPESKKTGKNVALAVSGWFLIVPWFFMDLSDAEKVEIRAYQERHLALEKLWSRKSCTGHGIEPVTQASAVEDAAYEAPIAKRIQVVNDLFEQGLISEEEYKSKRAKLLEDI